MYKIIATGLAALTLGACQPQTTTTSNPSKVMPATASQAAQVFDNACLKNSPKFAGSYLYLAKTDQYSISQESGVYFNRYIDLSVLVHVLEGTKVCTLVFFPKSVTPAVSRETLAYFAKKAGASQPQMWENNLNGRVYNTDPNKIVLIDVSEDGKSLRLIAGLK